MGKVHSIACGLPFCPTKGKQTYVSMGLRATAVVLGILAAVMGLLIALNVQGFGHPGPSAGWATFSVGACVALVGVAIKCIKTKVAEPPIPSARVRDGKPLVVHAPIVDLKLSEVETAQFRQLNEGSTVWIGEEKTASTIQACSYSAGARVAMTLSKDEVLMLPKKDIPLDVWQRMVDEEVQVSARLAERGVLVIPSKRVDLYMNENSVHPIPAYTRRSLERLANQGIYIIDSKNMHSSWKGKSYFKGDEDRYSVRSWLPIVMPLLKDIYTLTRENCFFDGDSLCIAIIENVQGYRARYFGIDFSRDYAVCKRAYGEREDDITRAVVQSFDFALQRLFWEQYDYDTNRRNIGLAKEYYKLIEEFKKQCPALLKEMQTG